MDPAMPSYLWLVVVGAFAAFGFGWGTGANDVANAFGTSVGAKTITLRQAVIIAAIFEFGGAMLLGRVVTATISGGIADPSVFASQPEIYAYGMVCALTVGFLWQGWASYVGLNVSATHSIIGGIIGFALAYKGGSAVQWATPAPNSFPPYSGVVPIILSWFFSPILTGLAAALIFSTVRTLVLRRENAKNIALWVLPPAVLVTVFINIFFVFTKGAAKTLGNDWPISKAAWVAAVIAVGTSALIAIVVLPLLKRSARLHHEKVERKTAEDAAAAAAANKEPHTAVNMEAAKDAANEPTLADGFNCHGGPSVFLGKLGRSMGKAALYGTSVDIHQVVEEDEFISALHARAEKFDERAEHIFGYLQVFSAICVVFSHGAGEVGFATGPLSAIYQVYSSGTLSKNVQPPIWTVLIGALSLVIGLATYGYNVTRTMGVAMAKLSPSRGFAAELSTALIILIASQLGLPTSSSQCITGGVVGVGLLEGVSSGVNWKLFAKQFASWVATLFVVGLGVAALFAQGIYTPSKIDGGQVLAYENGLAKTTQGILSNFNTTLQSYQPAAAAGALTNLNTNQWATLNETIADAADANKLITSTKGSTASKFNTAVAVLKQWLCS
eukprot:GHRR01007016.1.p1 GENE.GHRR01007016.1~~GHRR01007016.1.p1  ORF type:complete len:614 (+),score=157.23 GHRR01007016.1:344-2185(+)